MTKNGSTKFVNFMIPMAAVRGQGRGYIGHVEKIHYIHYHKQYVLV